MAGEFLGHGVFALRVKPSWLVYFTAVGLSQEMGMKLLPIIGLVDILLAILVLLKPMRLALLWMAFWGFWTALLRPLAGEPIWDFVERWANWGAPLALFFLFGWPKTGKEWFS